MSVTVNKQVYEIDIINDINYDYLGMLRLAVMDMENLHTFELINYDNKMEDVFDDVELPDSVKKVQLPNDYEENGFHSKMVEGLEYVIFDRYPIELLDYIHEYNNKYTDDYKLFKKLKINYIDVNLTKEQFKNHLEIIKKIEFEFGEYDVIYINNKGMSEQEFVNKLK